MPTPTERDEPRILPGFSMSDLLASCAAATTVSTPPRAPEPMTPVTAKPEPAPHREAA